MPGVWIYVWSDYGYYMEIGGASSEYALERKIAALKKQFRHGYVLDHNERKMEW